MRKLWAVAVPQLFLIFINLWPKKDDHLYGTKYMYSLTRRCRFCATSTYKIGLMTYDQQMNNASGPKTRKRTDGAFTKLLSHVDRTRRLEDLRSSDSCITYHCITYHRITDHSDLHFEFRGVPPVVGGWWLVFSTNEQTLQKRSCYRGWRWLPESLGVHGGK